MLPNPRHGRSEQVELDVSIRALRALRVFISFGKLSGQVAIRRYLSSGDIEHPVEKIARIIHKLSRLM